jgi:hypothetical protein
MASLSRRAAPGSQSHPPAAASPIRFFPCSQQALNVERGTPEGITQACKLFQVRSLGYPACMAGCSCECRINC